jgi:hypothetical protein
MSAPFLPYVKHVVRFDYNASFCSQNALLLLMLVIMDTFSHFILVLYLYHDCIAVLVTMLVAKKPYFCSADITSQSNLITFIYICIIMLKKLMQYECR